MEDLAAQPRAGLFASGVALPLQLGGWVDRIAVPAALGDEGPLPSSRSRVMTLRFPKSFKVTPGARINRKRSLKSPCMAWARIDLAECTRDRIAL